MIFPGLAKVRNRSFFRCGVATLIGFFIVIFLFVPVSGNALAAGVPNIISYQGRLADASGNLLGGSGTNYYFKFSIWDNGTVGLGNRVWPTATPSAFATIVRQGVFNVNIGDITAGYPDTLDYNFSGNKDIYLQIEVSADGLTFQTLSPRQRISASSFAKVAGSVSGTDASSFGTTTPINNSVVTIEATSSNSVLTTLRAVAGQVADLLQLQNSSGANIFTVDKNGGVYSSSTIFADGSITTAAGLNVAGLTFLTQASSTQQSVLDMITIGRTASTTIRGETNATSTFAGGVSALHLGVTTLTNCDTIDTDANGYFVCGTDSGSGSGSPGGSNGQLQFNDAGGFGGDAGLSYDKVADRLTTVNASTSNLSTNYASTSDLVVSNNFTLGNLTGFLKATAGAITASTISLATDVGGILGVSNGGTGWSNIQAGTVLIGNGTGALATTSAGTAGQVLALVGNTPTWVATTTLSTISGTLAITKGGTGLTSTPTYGQLLLGTAGGAYALTATSALGFLTTDVAEGSNLYFTNTRFDNRLATFDKGYFFSTTSADAWKNVNNFYSTTSANYWKTVNDFFSTTSVAYWETTQNRWATTSSDYWLTQINKGTFYSTTSADYWLTQQNLSAFSTTSANYWKTVNDFYSTTSADYWKTANNFFSTTSSDFWLTTKSTSDLTEGSNLYFTNNRFDVRLAATTSLPNLQFLAGLDTATTSKLNVTGNIKFSSLVNCDTIDTDANGNLVCGSDAGAGGGISSLNGLTASGQTFATTSDANITLSITSVGSTHTFTPGWTGTLAASRGGTGISSPAAAGILVGSYGGGSWQQLATSSLGLLTTNVAEGSNLYYTDVRFDNRLATFDKGYFFSTTSVNYWKGVTDFYSTTSANYWETTQNRWATTSSDYWKTANNFYSTTSADYWIAQINKGYFYSTTSSDYWLTTKSTSDLAEGSRLYYTDARVNSYINGSTTIPKTYTANIFTGNNTFTNATATTLAISSVVNSLLTTNSLGSVVATSSLSTAYGGTGLTSISSNQLLIGGVGNSLVQVATSALNIALSDTTGTLAINRGGTGLASTPTYGQVLLGNNSGGYDLVSTSSLGISGGSSQWSNSGSDIYFSTGKVGLGFTSPTETLDVNGVVRISPAEDAGILAFGDRGSGNGYYNTGVFRGGRGLLSGGNYLNLSSWDSIAFNTGNNSLGSQSTRMEISSAGDVAIGTSIDSSNRLSVAKNFSANELGTVAAFSATDIDDSLVYSAQGVIDRAGSVGSVSLNPYIGTGGLVVSGSSTVAAIGVYGSASGGALNYAGYFDGLLMASSTQIGNLAGAGSVPVCTDNDGNLTTIGCSVVGGSFSTTSADYWKTANNFFSTTSSDYWLTTKSTSDLAEGSNLYFTNNRFDSRLAATTSISGIISLPNLLLSATQLTNFGVPFYNYFSSTNTSALAEGSNLYYTDARVNTYLGGVDKGYFFSTTSVDYWETTQNRWATTSSDYWKTVTNFYSTTSADYWKTANNFFSTTSSDYWLTTKSTSDLAEGSNLYYTDTRVNSYVGASTTIAKLYTSNTFTGANTFSGSLTVGSLNGPLQANAGVISATSSIGVLYGGTGLTTAPSYGNLLLGNASGGYTLTATSGLGIALNDTTGILSLARGGTGTTTAPAGGVTFSDGSKLTSDPDNFYWNTATKSLGLGTVLDTTARLSVLGTTTDANGYAFVAGNSNGSYSVGFRNDGVLSLVGNQIILNDNNPIITMGNEAGSATASFQYLISGDQLQFLNGDSYYFDNKVGIGSSTPFATLAVNPVAGAAANMFAVGSSSATSFIVNNGGLVGVGTANPTARLHIVNADNAAGTIAIRVLTNDATQGLNITTRGIAKTGSNTNLTLDAQGTGNMLLQTVSTGNVGIASATPFAKLGVKGSGTDTGLTFLTTGSSDAVGLVALDSGLVGIGTTTPSRSLTVAIPNRRGELLLIDRLNSFTDSTTKGGTYLSSEAGKFQLQGMNSIGVGTSAYFTADQVNGRIGISSTTPYATLSVNGAGTGTGLTMQLSDSANRPRVTVLDNGSFGIGTTSPWRTLSVNGSMAITGLTSTSTAGNSICLSNKNDVTVRTNNTCSAASSIRFKQDINNLDNGLDQLLALRPVSYKYKADYLQDFSSNPNWSGDQVGFIAEEVRNIDPRLVTLDQTGQPDTVRYDKMSALIVKSIQTVWAKVLTLDTRIINLESQMAQVNNLASTTASLSTQLDNLASSTTSLRNISLNSQSVINGGLESAGNFDPNSVLQFNSDTLFVGRPYFNSDMGGSAVIKAGAKSVVITFDQDYLQTPIVSATIALESSSTASDAEDQIFSKDVRYLVTQKNNHGFTILLNKAAPVDINFTWLALAIKNPKVFISDPAQISSLPTLNSFTNSEPEFIDMSSSTSTSTSDSATSTPSSGSVVTPSVSAPVETSVDESGPVENVPPTPPSEAVAGSGNGESSNGSTGDSLATPPPLGSEPSASASDSPSPSPETPPSSTP